MDYDDKAGREDGACEGHGENEQVPNVEQMPSKHAKPDLKPSMKWDEGNQPPLEPMSSRANLIYDAGFTAARMDSVSRRTNDG